MLALLSLLACPGTTVAGGTGGGDDTPPGAQCTETDAWLDADGDGYGEEGDPISACGTPAGYASQPGDCRDDDPAAHPGAQETCNAVDDDCDGVADLGVAQRWHEDDDNDGYGDPEAFEDTCVPASGWVLDGTDCAPADPDAHPGAEERCNERDDNCDDIVDEGFDADADGYFDTACPTGVDCDDGDSQVHPGAQELCDSGTDEDCNGRDDACGFEGAYNLESDSNFLIENGHPGMGYMIESGDVNGDGHDDIFTGNFLASGGMVVFGPLGGTVDAQQAGTVHASDGSEYGAAGRSIGMGDVDGDGLEDVGFGAPYSSTQGIVVVLGPASQDTVLETDYGVEFVTNELIYAGHGCDIGDVTGDGVADLVVGAFYADEGNGRASGAGYVKYGPLSGSYDLLDDADGVVKGPEAKSYMGRWVRAGGDHDGDGIGDILIAAPFVGIGAPSGGVVYLLYGPAEGVTDVATEADGSIYASEVNAMLGEGRTFAQGDVDGDGLSDAVVGSAQYADDGGILSVIRGPAAGEADVALADLVITGTVGSFFGTAPRVGDLDLDGRGELIVTSPLAAGGAGETYLFWSPTPGRYTPGDADATVVGDAGDSSGSSTALGDVDNNGHLDLVIGASSHGGQDVGGIYGLLTLY